MGISTYIWDSCATTLQPNRFQSHTLQFFPPENTFFLRSDTHNLGDAICLPVSAVYSPELLEPTQSVTAIFHNLAAKIVPLGTLSVATDQVDFLIAHGGRACCVCALSAEESCDICEENLCWRHIYQCAECLVSVCGECFDLHHVEGHWSDSDTAAALVDSSCHKLEGQCSTVIPPESTTKTTSSGSKILTTATSLLTACCNSTLDKTRICSHSKIRSRFAAVLPEVIDEQAM